MAHQSSPFHSLRLHIRAIEHSAAFSTGWPDASDVRPTLREDVLRSATMARPSSRTRPGPRSHTARPPRSLTRVAQRQAAPQLLRTPHLKRNITQRWSHTKYWTRSDSLRTWLSHASVCFRKLRRHNGSLQSSDETPRNTRTSSNSPRCTNLASHPYSNHTLGP